MSNEERALQESWRVGWGVVIARSEATKQSSDDSSIGLLRTCEFAMTKKPCRGTKEKVKAKRHTDAISMHENFKRT
jgi:hypothetical protein